MNIQIRHLTRYSFAAPVTLGPHRLMLRPRDSFDILLISTGLDISPQAQVSWRHDAYGNSVGMATFAGETTELRIVSTLVLQRFQPTGPMPVHTPWQIGAPVAYSADERIVLLPYMTPACTQSAGEVTAFANRLVSAQPSTSGHPLLDLSAGIHAALTYQVRFEEGTQTPADTLRRGSGSCRDYAWLFIECARHLGYAARFVTGYLYNANAGSGDSSSHVASDSYSHAWADVFVPGAGWVEFDPTNLLVADRQLIRVAVTRTPGEASPVSGTYHGPVQNAGLEVRIDVSPIAASMAG